MGRGQATDGNSFTILLLEASVETIKQQLQHPRLASDGGNPLQLKCLCLDSSVNMTFPSWSMISWLFLSALGLKPWCLSVLIFVASWCAPGKWVRSWQTSHWRRYWAWMLRCCPVDQPFLRNEATVPWFKDRCLSRVKITLSFKKKVLKWSG